MLVIVAVVAGALGGAPGATAQTSAEPTFTPEAQPRSAGGGVGDATVVAVLDFGFVPYHWDFVASKMPQANDRDRSNDLPLNKAPHKWLPGFPNPSKAFASYQAIDLTLDEKNPDAAVEGLDTEDTKKWEDVKASTKNKINYYWMPGTKVIGALEFGPNKIHGTPNDHGTGTTSVSVGNLHGTCPECLLFFININQQEDAEAAIEWAESQPWIDAITNSYGFSLGVRDRLYSGSDVDAQKQATQRGQTIFFSAGNGQDGAFVIPNTTYYSSQEGPDWIVTVGAVSPGTHGSYTGAGKPADIAGIGDGYPAAYGSQTVSGHGFFGGTSNATPTIAGTYARALYLARSDLRGASRTQTKGVIARGGKFKCGRARKACELRDGKLTAPELRRRLFEGAVHTEAGTTDPLGTVGAPVVGEEEFMAEGYGSYFGRETGDIADWLAEFERILAPLEGRAKPLKRPEGEREWMVVDSFCRQHLWGAWTGGAYVEGKTELPGSDPEWPVRSQIEQTCPQTQPPVR
jgi:Subtilase family